MRQTKYCRVPIKQRLFSFNFTFQLSHYSILSFSPLLSSELDFVSRTPTIKWAWLCESYQPEIVFFPFWIWWQPSLFHRRIVNLRFFTFVFGSVTLRAAWRRLFTLILGIPLLSTRFFLKQKLFTLVFRCIVKRGYLRSTFWTYKLPKRFMAFPERIITQYLTGCNLYRIVPMHF